MKQRNGLRKSLAVYLRYVILLPLILIPTASSLFGSGKKWVGNGPEGGFINAIAVNPVRPPTLYICTRSGVFKSTDGRDNWIAVNTGLNKKPVKSLTIDPSDPQTVYAGTDSGLFRSADGGIHWNTVDTGLTNTSIEVLIVAPDTRTVYAGTSCCGVIKSSDAGSD